MTGVERLLAALNGTPADRIPVFCNLIDQGARELNMSLREYYSRGEYVAEGQLWMRERLGYDCVWGLFYAGKEAELLGCEKIRFAPNGPPSVEELIITCDADIDRLDVPHDLMSDPRFEQERACMETLRREAKGKHVICAYVTATMALPALLMGMGPWMELLLTGDPGLRDELLGKCHDFLVKQVRAYRELGADLILYTNPFGSTDFVPMKFFLEHALPWIQRDVQAVGADGLLYFGSTARIGNVIEPVRQSTSVGAWYLSPLDDIAAAKKIIGDTGLTCGVINDIRLISWSRDEIRNEVKRLLDAGMPGGHFLFGTGVMPYGIPDENIRVMLEAAFEYGRLEDDALG